MLRGRKDDVKPQLVRDQVVSNSPLLVGETGVRVRSGKEANHMTRFKSSVSRKER